MATTLPPIVEDILLSVLILVITITASWIASQMILSRLSNKMSKIALKWTARTAQYIIFMIGMYVVIYHILALDLRTFAASLGIIGIAVAFSSQQLIQNAIAGLLITIRRPVQLEDWIEVAGSGVSRVRDIGLLQTELRGVNGRILFVPNSVLLNSMITNYTKAGASLITVQITVPQGVDYDQMKELLLRSAKEVVPIVEPRQRRRHIIMKKLAPQIAALMETKKSVKTFEPHIIITDISNSRITLQVRLWTENIERRDEIVSIFLEKTIKDASQKGITIIS
jgi:small conductance mechanosensitive channel